MKRALLTMLGLTLAASAASAHPGHGIETTFAQGFGHPVGGLDHVLAMLSVGLLAVASGGRAIWLIPTTFVVAMVAGAALGFLGVGLPLVEPMIACSVIVLGALVAFGMRMPMVAVIPLIAVLAAFHGFAHGVEAPASGHSVLGYAAGFVLATALLHLAGIVTGLLASRVPSALGATSLRAGGTAISLAGVGLLLGVI